MIYFITARDIGRVKIGHAKDPKRRVGMLQTGSPLPLTLERVCAGGEGEEARLHARFSEYRIIGEWFELSPAIEAHMAELAEPPAKRRAFSGELSKAVGISRSHASEIVTGARQPSRALAIHIMRKTGWRHPLIADLSDAQIDLLETIEPWGRAA